MKIISVSDIRGFRLGNAENKEKGTGCSVIICEKGAVGGVDVRGGGPATRETDLLRSENTVNAVNAVVLSGGSAFGLEAASGVMRELADRKIGFDAGDDIVVPIVCGASLYDLPVGDPKAFPDVHMGIQAVRNAYEEPFEKGNHGAGTGATVGKLKGYDRAMKTGVGTFACGDGFIEVGAIAAVNAVGDIYNGAGNIIAGLRSEDGETIYGTIKTLKSMVHDGIRIKEDTTSFINRSELEEALAVAAKQYKKETAEEPEVSAVPEEEPAVEFVEEPAAEEIIEEPAAEESVEEFAEEPAEEIIEEFVPETPEEAFFIEVPEEEPEVSIIPEEEPAVEFVEEPAVEELTEEPAAEESVEEFTEEPEKDIVEEPAEEIVEEFVPKTPLIDIFRNRYRQYDEISIPVVSAETVPEEPETDTSEEIFVAEAPVTEPEISEVSEEEPAAEFVEEPATEEIMEETVAEESVEEFAEELAEEEIQDADEEVIEEAAAEESVEDTAEEPEAEFIEELAEEVIEEVAEEPATEEIIEETVAEESVEEFAEELAEEEIQDADEEVVEETAEEEVEEPVVLTREDMGYDVVFNTTISCLITNAALTKSQANKLASILHDAYARAIKPVHGTLDGDTVFVLATGKQPVNFDAFAALATDVMQYAIIDGAMSAEGAYGIPAARDMQKTGE